MRFVCLSGTINTNLSDHLPTFVLKKKTRETYQSRVFRGRCYKGLTPTAIKHQLCLSDLDSSLSPDENWGLMETAFITVANLVCPVRNFNIKRDRPNYFTDEVTNIIRECDILFKLARGSDDEALWSNATKKCKEAKIVIKRAKRDYVSESLNTKNCCVKKYWRNMTNFLEGHQHSNISEIVLPTGDKQTGDDAAETINRYFCDIGQQLAEKIIPTNKSFEPMETECRFRLAKVTFWMKYGKSM